MPDMKQLEINGTSYTIKDENARNRIAVIEGEISDYVTGVSLTDTYDSTNEKVTLTLTVTR